MRGLLLIIYIFSSVAFSKDFEISVIDSAVDFEHSLLNPHKSKYGTFDPSNNSAFTRLWDSDVENPEDWGHGTHVSGIIASYFDPGAENTPRINNIFHIKSLEDNSLGLFEKEGETDKAYFQNISNFLEKARPRIVNLSLGEDFLTSLISLALAVVLEEAFVNKRIRTRAINLKIRKLFNDALVERKSRWIDLFNKFPETLFVIAAGNEGRLLSRRKRLNLGIPVRLDKYIERLVDGTFSFNGFDTLIADIKLDNTLTVGSWNGNTGKPRVSSFSNYGGSIVDILAVGDNVLSSVPGGFYEKKSGTSMAAPQITGLAASILQEDLGLTTKELKQEIFKKAQFSMRFLRKSRFGRYFKK